MPAAIAADSPPLEPPGGAGEIPWIVRSAREEVVTFDPVGELRKIGLGKQDGACLLHTGDAGRIGLSGMRSLEDGDPRWVRTFAVSMESLAVTEHRGVGQVDRPATRLLPLPGQFESLIGNRNDGDDLRVNGLNAIKVRLHDFDGRDLSRADQFGQFCCIGVDQVSGHSAILSTCQMTGCSRRFYLPHDRFKRTVRFSHRYVWRVRDE